MAVIQREGSRQVYYEDYGEGSNAIVLIHAWGLSCRAWDSNTQALVRAGFRVIALDARGCGQSDKDFDNMTLSVVADDVAAIAETLGLKAVLLNGWSFGGAVAVIAAIVVEGRSGCVSKSCGAEVGEAGVVDVGIIFFFIHGRKPSALSSDDARGGA